MNEIDIRKKYAKNLEEQQLISRICDLTKITITKYCVNHTHFLTPVQQEIVQKISSFFYETDFYLEGGYQEAERKLALIYPKDYLIETEPSKVCVLSIHAREQSFSHRDILGAIMGLGIIRNRIGDILDHVTPPLIFCESVLAEFFIQNLIQIGRTKVSLEPIRLSEKDYEMLFSKKSEKITVFVPSLRLDAVVAEGFSLSRSNATKAVKQGFVFLNWNPEERPAVFVKEGDKISLRGKGKIELFKIGGLSRKGRIFLEISKYV